jgi:NADH dehydrogenase
MTILILGGTGFIGRHIATALAQRGHSIIIGSRHPSRAERRLPAALHRCERREVHLERLGSPEAWAPLLRGVDTVVNSVGILRERGAETYERVHHHGPGALAAACARGGIRLVHVSALGLHPNARSGFLSSKLAGERAIAASGANYSIVRPSLLDGEGGYGALWFRRVARWPIHPVPGDARGQIDPFAVGELGEAIAVLCEKRDARDWREVELGGGVPRSIGDHLASLRPTARRPAPRIAIPAWLVRLASHLFDLVHFSPLSFGHVELMRRDNLPRPNRLSELLGREPARIGCAPKRPARSCPGPRDVYGWRAVTRNVLPFFALLAAAPLLHGWSPIAPWLLAPLIGLFAYRITIVMHDCIHRSLFLSARLNGRVGVLLGGITCIDFMSFSRQHLLHHRLYGRPGDPQGFQYLGLKGATRLAFVWHVLRPLFGFNLRYALAESIVRPRNLAAAAHRGEILVLGAVQLCILAIVTGGGAHLWLAALPFASAATFGPFFSQLRGIAEHAAGADDAQAAKVRSHAPHWLDRICLYDLNFNYHEEHHLYPHYPSHDLAALHGRSRKPLAPSMLRTLTALALERA